MKIIGIGVVGPGEADRYMRKTMEEFKRLCDEVILVTNNATQKEKDLITEFGFQTYEDNREWGREQPNIKTDLLTRAGTLNPDWIIALDMDETFASTFTRVEAEKLAERGEIAWYFMIVNLYNDENHFAHDVGIQRFWNIRFYKYLPEFGLQFQRKPLHCGLAPPIAYGYGWYAPYYVLHYGLMLPEDRQRKIERYEKYDPQGKWKNHVYYDDLKRNLKMHVFDGPGLLRKLEAAPDCKIRIPPKLHENKK